MAKFTFNGDIEMVYVDVTDSTTGGTLLAVPGATYDLTTNPDENLFTSNSKKNAAPVAEEENN